MFWRTPCAGLWCYLFYFFWFWSYFFWFNTRWFVASVEIINTLTNFTVRLSINRTRLEKKNMKSRHKKSTKYLLSRVYRPLLCTCNLLRQHTFDFQPRTFHSDRINSSWGSHTQTHTFRCFCRSLRTWRRKSNTNTSDRTEWRSRVSSRQQDILMGTLMRRDLRHCRLTCRCYNWSWLDYRSFYCSRDFCFWYDFDWRRGGWSSRGCFALGLNLFDGVWPIANHSDRIEVHSFTTGLFNKFGTVYTFFALIVNMTVCWMLLMWFDGITNTWYNRSWWLFWKLSVLWWLIMVTVIVLVPHWQ